MAAREGTWGDYFDLDKMHWTMTGISELTKTRRIAVVVQALPWEVLLRMIC